MTHSRFLGPGRLAAAVALAALAAGAAAAIADVLILQSNVPTLKRGDRLGNADTIDVPAGKRVDILRPGGQTQSISGPRRIGVGELTRGEAMNEPVWKRVLEDLKSDSKSTGATGAVRGVSR
jgi:hypothetical protein